MTIEFDFWFGDVPYLEIGNGEFDFWFGDVPTVGLFQYAGITTRRRSFIF